MYQDEVIADVWKNREAYAKKHHHSLKEIVADMKRRQRDPHAKLVDLRSRNRPRVATARAA